jgi:hypothetical protein
MNAAELIQQSLSLIKSAQSQPLNKAYTQSSNPTSGLTFYDLEAGAKLLYPVLTPLRNMIPRVSGKGGIQANWRAITGINIGQLSAGVSQGNRGGAVVHTTKDYIAAYRGLGLEDYVTFEADYAAEGFDDVKALATRRLLESLMLQEEIVILGGNSTQIALGQPAAPTLTGSTTGGTLAAATWSVIVVALTLEGLNNAQANPDANGFPQVQGLITRNNTDGSTDQYGGGSSQVSPAATVTTTGTTSSITAVAAPIRGAVAYAWYLGAAGAERMYGITTTNSVVFTQASNASAQLASAIVSGNQDNSKNALVFDGLLSIALGAGSNAYVKDNAGAPLTADSAGGVVEIDDMLKDRWDNYRLSPDMLLVSSQEQGNINKKVLAGATSQAQRFVFTVDQAKIAGGTMVTSYKNKYSMNGAVEIPINLHPNMPAGTILALTTRLPYPMSNVTNVIQIRTRREYYQIEWPLRSRKYEYGVYCDEVLQHYFPPSMGVITNIANG